MSAVETGPVETTVTVRNPPCTHRAHASEPHVHWGPAVAFCHYHCPDCGRDRTVLVCAPYVEVIEQDVDGNTCTCGVVRPPSQTHTIVRFEEMR